jgi:pSer/pThr/pTyr-binding forkhead associated (FHA) protein
MATLLIKSQGFDGQIIQLKMGPNRFGRSSKNDFQIEDATVSAHHCDIILGDAQVTVVDRDSTNGTYVDSKRVKEAILSAGQTLRLGDVDFLVESTEVSIAIPKFDRPMAAPPVVLSDGSLICPRHKGARATHQCTHCREVLCDTCVHRLRRKGGTVLLLCPLCSHACEPIGGEKKKKKSLLGFLQRTVKLPFLRESKKEGS